MAECAGFENRFTRNGNGGSNPSLSANSRCNSTNPWRKAGGSPFDCAVGRVADGPTRRMLGQVNRGALRTGRPALPDLLADMQQLTVGKDDWNTLNAKAADLVLGQRPVPHLVLEIAVHQSHDRR